jgi:hypothetical protein
MGSGEHSDFESRLIRAEVGTSIDSRVDGKKDMGRISAQRLIQGVICQ